MTLKIATLLAHYLYANKKLDLPGFGTFLLETNTIAVPENQKNKPILLEGVSFLQNTSVKEDPELITYISSHTGKIKPLASSDLESHLELAKQFLNIGKPFLLEGIGTISASKRDEYVFTPGIMLTEPLHEHNSHEQHHEVAEGPTDYKEVFYSKKKGQAWQKPFIFFLVIAGITFAVWGGYTVYKNSSDSKEKVVEEQKENTIFSADSSANTPLTVDTGSVINQKPDSAASVTVQPPAAAGSYKFIVETAEKERALPRFEKLKNSFNLPVLMETKDSVKFNIYFVLRANPADTARMIDSLQRAYTPPGKRAYVE